MRVLAALFVFVSLVLVQSQEVPTTATSTTKSQEGIKSSLKELVSESGMDSNTKTISESESSKPHQTSSTRTKEEKGKATSNSEKSDSISLRPDPVYKTFILGGAGYYLLHMTGIF
ncbi:hypothetical protein BB560_003016 [Smittium megazygosporum]|uniref:Uncharacterized protein n=1 Tax=Smittium megazygosporum TaxID=133381 RepID=A0A2T9ZD63_9FUNG|nr:hypothetical protein BB560_003016 [Smittium megazygosporum]